MDVMDPDHRPPSGSDDYPRQRVIRRNRVFVLLPITALLVSAALIIWEVARLNLSNTTRSQWPWRLNLLDLQSAATIFTVLLAIVLTRFQYAVVTRPMIGWGLHPADESFLRDNLIDLPGAMWSIDAFNGGGGPATLESIHYKIAITPREPTRWLNYREAMSTLVADGMVIARDFHLTELGAGTPLVPTARPRNSIHIAVFTADAMLRLGTFDVRIRMRDNVGDIHERILDCARRIPRYLRPDAGIATLPDSLTQTPTGSSTHFEDA